MKKANTISLMIAVVQTILDFAGGMLCQNLGNTWMAIMFYVTGIFMSVVLAMLAGWIRK